MATSRSYAGHIGFIQSIEAISDERFIFTNSVQCVIQWFVMNEDSLWDLYFYPFDIQIPDPFNDVLNVNYLMLLKFLHGKIELVCLMFIMKFSMNKLKFLLI